MKHLLLFACAALMALPSGATVGNDTIVDVKNAHHVLVTSSGNNTEITISGLDSDPGYHYHYFKASDPDAQTNIEEKASKWDFSIPLKRSSNHFSSDIVCGGVGFGFATAFGLPEGAQIDMGNSYEIFFDLIGLEYSSSTRKHTFSVRFGFDWKNYRMTGQKRFMKDGTNIIIDNYPEGTDINFSRLHLFSLTFPFTYEYHFTRNFSAYIGAILNFNTYASLKTRYHNAEGERVKEFYKGLHQRKLTVDLTAGLRFKWFGAYVKYNPCHILNPDFGPSLTSLSTGFTFFY